MNQRYAVLAFYVLLLESFGCSAAKKEDQAMTNGQRLASESDPVKLSIAADQDVNGEGLLVRLELGNDGTRALFFDSEFAVFVSWTVKTRDGLLLRPVHVSDVERGENSVTRGRFVMLNPGERISKTVDLAKGLRHFGYGHGSAMSPGGVMSHIPTGYEEIIRYDIPESCREVTVQVEYLWDNSAREGFYGWFGYSADDVSLWNGGCRSGVLRIPMGTASSK